MVLADAKPLRSLPYADRIERPLRFALVGATCSVFQLACLALFVWLGIPHVVANLLALLCSTEVSFTLSTVFIWPDRRSEGTLLRRLLAFNVTSAGTLLINEGVFALTVHHLPYLLAGALGIAVAAPANYLISHYLVFTVRGHQHQTHQTQQQQGMS